MSELDRSDYPSPPGRDHHGADTEELGTARWTTPAEASQSFGWDDHTFFQDKFYLWNGNSNGQIWIGETADVASDPLGYADDRHVCLVSGSRGGKGTGIIIPNLCFWPGSCIVIDPKGENANVTARRRGAGSAYCYGLGQDVYVLDPFGEVQLDAVFKACYNPLDAIDPLSDLAVDDAGRIAASLVISDGATKDAFFEDSALNLVKGLILHVLTEPAFAEMRNLVTVWRLVNQGDWLSVDALRAAGKTKIPSGFDLLWQGMKESSHYNGLVAGLGEEMLSMSDRTRDGIRKTAATHLDFISGPPMQRVLGSSDFKLDGIKKNPRGVTIYLTLPQRYMKTHFRWLRLMTDLAVGEMERIKGRPATRYPTLFLLDEFAGLKRMEIIEHAAAQAAGFGAKFFFVVQSLVQLKDIYKDNWETFLGNAGLKLYFNIEDDFTRNYLSRQLGEREVRRKTQTGSQTRAQGTTATSGTSDTSTSGTSDSTTTGRSSGTTDSETRGGSTGWSKGSSSGNSYGGSSGTSETDTAYPTESTNKGENWTKNRGTNKSKSGGSSWSSSTGRNSSDSESTSRTTQQSRSTGTSFSQSRSSTDSATAGWSEGVHKRLLLNSDEIGRVFAPISDKLNPAYPGLIATLVVGQQPSLARRINYFDSPRFQGFFDPHPDHPPPLTLYELMELRKPKPLPKPPPHKVEPTPKPPPPPPKPASEPVPPPAPAPAPPKQGWGWTRPWAIIVCFSVCGWSLNYLANRGGFAGTTGPQLASGSSKDQQLVTESVTNFVQSFTNLQSKEFLWVSLSATRDAAIPTNVHFLAELKNTSNHSGQLPGEIHFRLYPNESMRGKALDMYYQISPQPVAEPGGALRFSETVDEVPANMHFVKASIGSNWYSSSILP